MSAAARRRPRIGVTLDVAGERQYALPRAYVDAVLGAGGLPILLPHAREVAAAYLAPSTAWSSRAAPSTCRRSSTARSVERSAASRTPSGPRSSRSCSESPSPRACRCSALAAACNVSLNVVRGDHQDLPADAGMSGHEQPALRRTRRATTRPSPPARKLRGARRDGSAAGELDAPPGGARPARGMFVSARRLDGVIEAIELPDLPFALGGSGTPRPCSATSRATRRSSGARARRGGRRGGERGAGRAPRAGGRRARRAAPGSSRTRGAPRRAPRAGRSRRRSPRRARRARGFEPASEAILLAQIDRRCSRRAARERGRAR